MNEEDFNPHVVCSVRWRSRVTGDRQLLDMVFIISDAINIITTRRLLIEIDYKLAMMTKNGSSG